MEGKRICTSVLREVGFSCRFSDLRQEVNPKLIITAGCDRKLAYLRLSGVILCLNHN